MGRCMATWESLGMRNRDLCIDLIKFIIISVKVHEYEFIDEAGQVIV